MFQQEPRLDTVPLLTMPVHTQIPSTKADQRANFHLSWLWGVGNFSKSVKMKDRSTTRTVSKKNTYWLL